MVSMRTIDSPRCLRARGWTSRSSHLASAATMSQVTVGGGENATCCDPRPTLMRRIGAGVPQAGPSRMGVSGTTTASTPFRSAAQCAWAASRSCVDHSMATVAGLSRGTRGHGVACTAGEGRGRVMATPVSAGAACWANADWAQSTQNAAAIAQRL